jgi:hypothetical protein
MSKRAKARGDGSNGSMGHDIFFGASVCGRAPSGLATTVSPIKQNHFLVKSYKPMTHLTHCPMKTRAITTTPTQPSATHRAMGHANRLTLLQMLWQDAVHALA